MGTVRWVFGAIGAALAVTVVVAALGNGPGKLAGPVEHSFASFSAENGEFAYATVIRNVGGQPLTLESVTTPVSGVTQTEAFVTVEADAFNYATARELASARALPAVLEVGERAHFYVVYQIVDCDLIGEWAVGGDGLVGFTTWSYEPVIISATSGSTESTLIVTDQVRLGLVELGVCAS